MLAAIATDAVPQGQGNAASASGRHDLTAKTISGLEIANVLFAGEQTYIIWKPTLHIPRPRARLQRPAVYFTTSLHLTSTALNASRRNQSDTLKSFEPLPGNVLEPLRFDSKLKGSSIHLPEDRITKVLPGSTSARDEVKFIRGATKRAFPIVPALFTRIRYSTLPDSLIASLHLEIPHLVNGSMTISNVSIDVEDAEVRHLNSPKQSQEFQGGDESVRLYKLTPSNTTPAKTRSEVSVKIHGAVSIEQGLPICIETSWQAHIDLSKVGINPTYRWSRPLSGGPLHALPRPSLQPASRLSSAEVDRHASTGWRGMTLTFTARPSVAKEDDFSCDVHCINRSSRPRRFALVMVHRKRHHVAKEPQASSRENADLIASIFNVPALDGAKSSDVLDVNPDVRIGPLPAGAVFETRLKFRAVATGPLDLGTVRVVDLDTRQTIDVRELPDIVAHKTVVQAGSLSR